MPGSGTASTVTQRADNCHAYQAVTRALAGTRASNEVCRLVPEPRDACRLFAYTPMGPFADLPAQNHRVGHVHGTVWDRRFRLLGRGGRNWVFTLSPVAISVA
jgi:hypothetical protein